MDFERPLARSASGGVSSSAPSYVEAFDATPPGEKFEWECVLRVAVMDRTMLFLGARARRDWRRNNVFSIAQEQEGRS